MKAARYEDEMLNKGQLTRQRIIEIAAPIFNQRGYEGCSMQAVMEATGLEKGCLYRHFSSKEELAAEAFRYALRQAVKMRTADLDHIEGAVAKLRHIVQRFVEAPSPMAGGCPLMNTALDADDGNLVLRRLAAEGLSQWKSGLSGIVTGGIQSGEIMPHAEPQRIADTVIATLEGALMISRIEGTRNALRHAQATLEMVLDSIDVSKA
jgi:TetR/AcrR family transcriptional regulator, transcriptional repressor for nem operon